MAKTSVTSAAILCLAACMPSPSGCRREMTSGSRVPAESELVGRWQLTEPSIRAAIRTGLSVDHDAVSRHYLVLSPGGTCAAEMRASYCGHFQSDWLTNGKTCRWKVWNPRGHENRLNLMLGEGRESFVFELHLIDRDELVLWMHLCDPDSDEYVELTKAPGVR